MCHVVDAAAVVQLAYQNSDELVAALHADTGSGGNRRKADARDSEFPQNGDKYGLITPYNTV